MAQKTEISFLEKKQLEKLDTKRLLALKRTVLAKKSALYCRNKIEISGHPFDINIDAMKKDKDDYNWLKWYHHIIKSILDNRENVKS